MVAFRLDRVQRKARERSLVRDMEAKGLEVNNGERPHPAIRVCNFAGLPTEAAKPRRRETGRALPR